MPGMIRVKMPKLASGWAWLSEEDFKKPRPDGGKWEKWDEKPAAPSEKAVEPAAAESAGEAVRPKRTRRGV